MGVLTNAHVLEFYRFCTCSYRLVFIRPNFTVTKLVGNCFEVTSFSVAVAVEKQ